mmetsp:Transcript_108705/g.325164  ORF Transcript_108705/g.325164 Transcript_108705/m.325164 type:complete len:216 (+) Transcript_108705:723-1370(+)
MVRGPVHDMVRDLLTLGGEGRPEGAASVLRGTALPTDLGHAAAEQREVYRPQRHFAVHKDPEAPKGGLHAAGGGQLSLQLGCLFALALEVGDGAGGHLRVFALDLLRLLLPRPADIPHVHLQGGNLSGLLVLDDLALRGVGQTKFGVQLEVHKLHHGAVELQEGEHHAEVHLRRHLLHELVRRKPRHRLAADLSLVIVALDRSEDLAQGLRPDGI